MKSQKMLYLDVELLQCVCELAGRGNVNAWIVDAIERKLKQDKGETK